MGLYLNPGNDAFAISVNDDIYIDKTGMIEVVNSRLGKRKRFLCVSRPRRFGKSMDAEMLSAYYDRNCESRELFETLEIAKKDSYLEHLNQYDVFFLNMQQFLSGAGSPDQLVTYVQQTLLEEVREQYKELVPEKETRLSNALATVYSKESHPNKGFVFIIDEWDCIFREARGSELAQRNYLDFLKDLFKDRTYVKLAYMTGILPVKKYGTHSALNIFDEFSMTAPGQLAQYVGFLEKDVSELCKRHDMEFVVAQKWYDGYRFKNTEHIYNPKSIVDAMMEKEFRSYWTSTETYEALQVYIDLDFDGLKQAIVTLLCGGECEIDVGTFQNDMTTFKSKDDILTLLVHLGYLAYDEKKQTVLIPNEEVRQEFLRSVKTGKRTELIRIIENSDALLDATLRLDGEEVARRIQEVHSAVVPPLFYNNEQALRSVIQFAYISSRDQYMMQQELPSGTGYADIVLIPVNTDRPAIVLELKKDRSASGAINQIREKNYTQVLNDYYGDILLVGINYDSTSKQHTCVIEKHVRN